MNSPSLPSIQRVAIVGLGLIGGSLGYELKKSHPGLQIYGISRKATTIERAVGMGCIDEGATVYDERLKGCQLVFLCPPIHETIPTLKKALPFLSPGTIVTDAASIKGPIVKEADPLMPEDIHFIGSHPMAGTEHQGIEAAVKGLFDQAVWALTPTGKASPQALSALKNFLSKLPVRLLELDPEEHDLSVAAISHLPIAVASALVSLVMKNDQDFPAMKQLAASGFRDTTRVASGNPTMGADILINNRQAVIRLLKEFRDALDEIQIKMETGNYDSLLKELEAIKAFRDDIYPKK